MTWDNIFSGLLVYLFSWAGYIISLIFGIYVIHQDHHTPSGTSAWLVLILFMPMIGIPAYLLFGGRKMRRIANRKPDIHLRAYEHRNPYDMTSVETLFNQHDLPRATVGNKVSFHPNGIECYDTLLDLIDSAEECINVVVFILKSDMIGKSIVRRLIKKAKEGVKVRLLVDSFGSLRFSNHYVRLLRKAGGEVTRFIPMPHFLMRGRTNLRNHRKIIIVDGKKAWVGGRNFGLEYMGPTYYEKRWPDMTFIVQGPAVSLYQIIFQSDWEFANNTVIKDVSPAVTAQDHGNAILQVVPSGPDVDQDPLYNGILSCCFEAKERLWFVTPYFVPDHALNRALCIAAKRGVDVRIITPKKTDHFFIDLARGTFMRQLHQAGGKLCLYKPGMLHGKAMIMDNHLAMVGSANIDVRSLFLNYEISTFFYSAEEIAVLEKWMNTLLLYSETSDLKVNFIRETIERMFRVISPIL